MEVPVSTPKRKFEEEENILKTPSNWVLSSYSPVSPITNSAVRKDLIS
jgi:hypothetical protein